MKSLTKYFKVVLCFMAFALCSFMFAFTPTLTAIDAAKTAVTGYNVAINALKMPTEEVDYNSDDETKKVFRVPLLENVLGATSTNYTIRVVDPAGYPHNLNLAEVNKKEDITDKFFTIDGATLADSKNVIINAKNDGEYNIIYIVTEGADEDARTYYSNTYKVTVKNVSYELDFSTPVLNSAKEIVGYTKNLMPSKLAVSNEAYELPVAYAKITGEDLSIDGEGKVTNYEASISVTKDGAPQKMGEDNSIFYSQGGKYYILPSEEGVYTIEYSFESSSNRPTKTFTINVEEGYVAEDLELASTPTMPKIELGKTITLPKITVNSGSESNVDVNVTSIKIAQENGSGYCELKNNNLEFVMSPENFIGVDDYEDMVGNYRITYTVEDVNGKTLTETFKVTGVTVSTNPTIKLSYDYDVTEDNFADNVNFGAEVELKAEYASNDEYTEFILPAVYVEDAVTSKSKYTSLEEFKKDFIIVRAIRKGSTYYYVDNVKYDEDAENGLVNLTNDEARYSNVSEDPNIGDPTKAVKFKFHANAQNREGTYYLEYRVISRKVKTRENNVYVEGTSTPYSFKVVASTTLEEKKNEKATPTVEITNLKDGSSVKNTDDITVKVTATDKYDTRLKNAVFTYSSKKDGVGKPTLEENIAEAIDDVQTATGYKWTCNIFEDEKFETEMKKYYNDFKVFTESEETKNSFALDLSAYTSGAVSVAAVSINDFAYIGSNVKVLNIKNTADADEPQMNVYVDELKDLTTEWTDSKWLNSSDKIQEFKVGQGVDVKLPTVYIADDDKTLSLNVSYYIDSPENSYGGIKYLSPSNKNFYYDSTIVSGQEVQVIDGGVITTTETGIYYVAYTATDVAGNTSVMYFTFEVIDTSKPILSVEPVADDVTISGNTVTGGKGTVIDFETTLKSSDGSKDYTSYDNISITIDDGGKGLEYQPSGDSRTSYVFNSYGTYIVTISGEYTTVIDDKGTPATDDDETKTLIADNKIVKVVIEKQAIEWLGEFDVPTYASKKQTIKLPDVAASNGAVVKVQYVAPGDSTSEAVNAEKVTDKSGYTYWSFETNETSKGTYKVIYTATTDEDVLTKTISIKVGDNVAPTLSYNVGELAQNYIYNGESDIEYVIEVNKKDKTFVVKVVNNGEEVISHDIGLVISDRDDTNPTNSNMSWTNLTYELTGDNVTKGDTTTSGNTTTTQYLISGVGSYSLKFSMKDSYDNINDRESIDFKVVEKSEVKENNDNLVGTILIVVSLVLLAGVILFFTFTGKKGKGTTSTKTKKEKVAKTKTVESNDEVKVEEKEAVVEEAKVETAEETESVEEVESENVETKVDEEPKTGDVE